MEKWTYESNYLGKDYSEYYVAYSKSLQSGIIVLSNYNEIKKQLDDNEYEYEEVSFRHFACGSIDALLIYESELEAIKLIEICETSMYKYPILNEELFDKMYNDEYESYKKLIINDCKNGLYEYWDLTEDYNEEQLRDVIDKNIEY